MKSVSINKIKEFDKNYKSDKNNKVIENAIKNVGINKVCLNNDIINQTYNVFNIELPKSKIYNQVNSERCWIHAGVNLIKNNVAKNLNVDESEYALSINYLSFLDKLEKSNTLYNKIVENNEFDLNEEIKQHYLTLSVYEGGYFEYFRSLVNKYGIVPESVMPDVESSKNSLQLIRIYRDKVKKDIFKLLELKKKETNKEILYSEKEKMLNENYNI